MKFATLTVCADMHGCPNRCRHCWLGHGPNGQITTDAFVEIAQAFRPYADSLEMDTWYREPDFADDYRELWNLRASLSDRVTPHFELCSVWRAVRDGDYIPWLYEMGVREVQLTLFGDEVTTDRFTGRRGAYGEILRTMDLLLENGILPRVQVFIYKENIGQLPHVDGLIDTLALPERCRALGGAFHLFLHPGSCEGAAAGLYENWITPQDVALIPERLMDYTRRYFGKSTVAELFGEPEAAWVERLRDEPPMGSPVSGSPVFFVDRQLDVYPNITTPTKWWRLGNLLSDGAADVVENYRRNRSFAQDVMTAVPLGEMVRAVGAPDSGRLFSRGDYRMWVLNRYLEIYGKDDKR